MNLTIEGGTDRQRQLVEAAIANCAYPFDDLAITLTVRWGDPRGTCTLPHTYMCTDASRASQGEFTVTIAPWADISTEPPPAKGLPDYQVQEFYMECFVHELGHVVAFDRLSTTDLQAQAAALFTHIGDGRRGTLADYENPTEVSLNAWAERLKEAIAEWFKVDTYTAPLLFRNRTNWTISPDDWAVLAALLLPPAVGGTPRGPVRFLNWSTIFGRGGIEQPTSGGPFWLGGILYEDFSWSTGSFGTQRPNLASTPTNIPPVFNPSGGHGGGAFFPPGPLPLAQVQLGVIYSWADPSFPPSEPSFLVLGNCFAEGYAPDGSFISLPLVFNAADRQWELITPPAWDDATGWDTQVLSFDFVPNVVFDAAFTLDIPTTLLPAVFGVEVISWSLPGGGDPVGGFFDPTLSVDLEPRGATAPISPVSPPPLPPLPILPPGVAKPGAIAGGSVRGKGPRQAPQSHRVGGAGLAKQPLSGILYNPSGPR